MPVLSPRRQFVITSGDTKIICNPKATAEQLNRWAKEKWGELEPDDLTWSLPAQLGLATEEVNLRFLAHDHGEPVVDQQKFIEHDTLPFAGTIDGILANKQTVVDAKNMNPWGDVVEAVARWTPQIVHSMIITGLPNGMLSILKGFTREEHFIVVGDTYKQAHINRCLALHQCLMTFTLPGELALVPPPIPPELWREINLETASPLPNWAAPMIESLGTWSATREAAAVHAETKVVVKGLLPDDVARVVFHDITVRRAKNGAVTIATKEAAA